MADTYVIGTEWEQVTLSCQCGTGINGAVKPGGVEAAKTLFDAHHQGPKCSPRIEWEKRREYAANSPLPRITPERICGSAWWTINGRPERHARAISDKPEDSQDGAMHNRHR